MPLLAKTTDANSVGGGEKRHCWGKQVAWVNDGGQDTSDDRYVGRGWGGHTDRWGRSGCGGICGRDGCDRGEIDGCDRYDGGEIDSCDRAWSSVDRGSDWAEGHGVGPDEWGPVCR